MFKNKKEYDYLDVYDVAYCIDEFNKELLKETGFANWLNTKIDWKFVILWDEELDKYDKGSFVYIKSSLSAFVVNSGIDLDLEVGKKDYIKNRITNKYITEQWLEDKLASFKPWLIHAIKILDEKYKQQYKDKNFSMVKYNDEIGLLRYDNRFYIVDFDSFKKLEWDNILMSFNMDDTVLSFFKDDKFKVYLTESETQYSIQKNVAIAFKLPMLKDEYGIVNKMIKMKNSFTKSIIHPDNWKLLEVLPFGFKSVFDRDGMIKNPGSYSCLILDPRNGYLIFNNNYKSIVAWLDDIEERNKNKPLTDNELLDILKWSYKDGVRSNHIIKK